MIRSVIRGIGSYVPPRVVSNAELAGMMDTSDEWIKTRTGIDERRFADEGVSKFRLGPGSFEEGD